MRWLFLLLLVLNLGYLAWELNREHAQQGVSDTLPRGVEKIVLLSELESEIRANEDSVQVASAELTAKVAGQEPVTEPSDRGGTSLEKVEALKDDVQTAQAASPENVAVVEDLKQVGQQDAVSAGIPAAKPQGYQCYTLGPFREMKTLRLVTREIKDYVIEASFRSREEQEQTMFRVLLKPVGSKQEAKALIKELVSNNIRDYFIISEGPSKNGISLGYFSSKGRAHRHADRVRKLGFDVVAEPVFRTYTIYWLDYRIEAGNEIPQKIFDEHLENTAQRLSRSCS